MSKQFETSDHPKTNEGNDKNKNLTTDAPKIYEQVLIPEDKTNNKIALNAVKQFKAKNANFKWKNEPELVKEISKTISKTSTSASDVQFNNNEIDDNDFGYDDDIIQIEVESESKVIETKYIGPGTTTWSEENGKVTEVRDSEGNVYKMSAGFTFKKADGRITIESDRNTEKTKQFSKTIKTANKLEVNYAYVTRKVKYNITIDYRKEYSIPPSLTPLWKTYRLSTEVDKTVTSKEEIIPNKNPVQKHGTEK